MFNPLTPGAFWQKWFFGHFGYLQPGYEPNKLQSIQNRIFNVTEGLSFHQHYFCFMIFLLLYAQKTKLQDLLLQAFFIFFFLAFSFSPFHIFLLQWLPFYWACFQFKNSLESVIETEVAKFQQRISHVQLREKCSTQMSKKFCAYFRFHLPNHSDLGITGKISSCKT